MDTSRKTTTRKRRAKRARERAQECRCGGCQAFTLLSTRGVSRLTIRAALELLK